MLDKVRKLLALSGSSNPHEAEAAARAAQALVSKYRLEAALEACAPETPAEAVGDGREAPLEVGRRIRKWKRVLAQALAEANGGAAWVLEGERDERLCVVARASDRDAVQVLYDGLVRRIEWASATAGEGRSRRWHEAFRIGVVDTLIPRLADGAEDARDGLEPSALVHVDAALASREAALQRYMDAHFEPSKRRGLRVDADGYEKGRVEGRTMKRPGVDEP